MRTIHNKHLRVVYSKNYPIKSGNTKITEETLCLNFSGFEKCVSREKGYCKIEKYCYDRKSEYLWKKHLDYINRHAALIQKTGKKRLLDIYSSFTENIKTERNIQVKYLRFSESGEIRTEKNIEKLAYIAVGLKDRFGVKTYGYTKRLDFLERGLFDGMPFVLNVSDYEKYAGKFNVFKSTENMPRKGKYICRGKCAKCNLCKHTHGNVIWEPLRK